MKREVKKDFIMETYNSFTELLETCDSRKQNFGDARTEEDFRFTGVHNYEEARELLQYGYSKDIKYIQAKVGELQKQGTVNKPKFINDIVGYAPIVPNAIIGIPQSMINQKMNPKKAKVVTVVYNGGNPARRDKKDILEYGAKFVSYVMNLEKQGFRVKIDSLLSFNNGDSENYILRVPVKSEFNPIDLKRICFPLIHSAMQRSIGFDWYERLPEARQISGYGRELCTMGQGQRQKILDKFLKKNEYFVCYGMDLDEVFKGVK